MIRNMNTIEDYRALDKAAVLNRAAKTVIQSSYLSNPVSLTLRTDLGRNQ